MPEPAPIALKSLVSHGNRHEGVQIPQGISLTPGEVP
jgi:hypothetical protein